MLYFILLQIESPRVVTKDMKSGETKNDVFLCVKSREVPNLFSCHVNNDDIIYDIFWEKIWSSFLDSFALAPMKYTVREESP